MPGVGAIAFGANQSLGKSLGPSSSEIRVEHMFGLVFAAVLIQCVGSVCFSVDLTPLMRSQIIFSTPNHLSFKSSKSEVLIQMPSSSDFV